MNKYNDEKKYNFTTKQKCPRNSTKSNKSSNLNSKLRDMTVYTSTKMFFANVNYRQLNHLTKYSQKINQICTEMLVKSVKFTGSS